MMMPEQPKLLLVDDTPANLVAAKAVLEGMGCQVLEAESGQRALRLMKQHEFALVLLDVQMPVMDGYEVAKRIRDNPQTKDVPIMFVTADRSPKPLEKFMAAGVVGNLYKPLDPDLLQKKVTLFLNIYKQKQRKKTQRIDSQ